MNLTSNRTRLAANIRQSLQRLPQGHHAIPAAMETVALLESDIPMSPKRLTDARMNADWYVDYLEMRDAARGVVL